MHLSDGILSGSAMIVTSALACGGIAIGLTRLDYQRIPRVGLLAAAFFVASLIHVPVGVSSAHLLLIGLMGVLLGWAVFPALAAALFLQVIEFGFGGFTSLGANILNMGLPAVLCYALLAKPIRNARDGRKVFLLGFAAGALGVIGAAVMLALTLCLVGREFFAPAVVVLLAHLPVIVVEGLVTGSAVAFLHKVKPDVLHPMPFAPRNEGDNP